MSMSKHIYLCTSCHQKETTALRRRLRDAKLGESAKGTSDIRGFFTKNNVVVQPSKVVCIPSTVHGSDQKMSPKFVDLT